MSICSTLTVLLDASPQSNELVVKVLLSSTGPETQQELGLGGDGSRNGKDGIVDGACLDGGEESDGVEPIGTLDVPQFPELSLEVDLRLGSFGKKTRAACVEATNGASSRAGAGQQSQQEESHGEGSGGADR